MGCATKTGVTNVVKMGRARNRTSIAQLVSYLATILFITNLPG